MLSETDLNKSSSLAHDYDKEFTVRVRPIWVRADSQTTLSGSHVSSDRAWIMDRSTSATVKITCIMAQSCHMLSLTKRSPDHTRVPNKAIWNIAPHCETTNQQACLSEKHIELCSGIHAGRKMGRKTSHIPSLITALPNQVFNNQPFR